MKPAFTTAPTLPCAHAGMLSVKPAAPVASCSRPAAFAIITAASALVIVALGLNVPSS